MAFDGTAEASDTGATELTGAAKALYGADGMLVRRDKQLSEPA